MSYEKAMKFARKHPRGIRYSRYALKTGMFVYSGKDKDTPGPAKPLQFPGTDELGMAVKPNPDGSIIG